MTFEIIDVTKIPFPEVNNRCVLYDLGIPTHSVNPDHLDLCRQATCAQPETGAEFITQHAAVLKQWQSDTRLSAIYQSILDLIESTHQEDSPLSIRISSQPFQINNGRHRICAAKKFGVKQLLVAVTSDA